MTATSALLNSANALGRVRSRQARRGLSYESRELRATRVSASVRARTGLKARSQGKRVAEVSVSQVLWLRHSRDGVAAGETRTRDTKTKPKTRNADRNKQVAKPEPDGVTDSGKR